MASGSGGLASAEQTSPSKKNRYLVYFPQSTSGVRRVFCLLQDLDETLWRLYGGKLIEVV